MSTITMKEFLEAGVHFGHQTRRWNPKMKEYIYGERNGIYIIDLQKTLKLFKEATKFLAELARNGRVILFVGTKRQAQEAVSEEAQRCQMFYINHRWLGGLLTNHTTIQRSIQRLRELEEMSRDGRYDLLTKKEVQRLERERKHLVQNLAGIKDMPGLPDALFVVDSNKEEIAVLEARKLGIPVVAVVDTNCNPDVVDYVIPGNDDALRAIRLFTSRVADAIMEGRQMALEKQMEEEKIAAEKAAEELEARRQAEAIEASELIVGEADVSLDIGEEDYEKYLKLEEKEVEQEASRGALGDDEGAEGRARAKKRQKFAGKPRSRHGDEGAPDALNLESE
ncbi:MAG: 30S ribosomal protein S2 [Acidobacteria bacterium]|nr:MAG: 30S ribosomal protein S2 [Acidobacteriota bacterium]